MYLLLIPSKTSGRVSSQQGAPTTGCNPTYREVSNQKYIQTLLAPVWVWSKGKIEPFSGGGARIIQMAHSSYSWTSNPLGHPKLSISQPHFSSKDILSFPNLIASTNFACRTDILRKRSIGCLWLIMISPTAVYPSLFQWRLIGRKRAVSMRKRMEKEA